MTNLLKQAIGTVCALPEEQQDAVAANLIMLIDYRLNDDQELELIEGCRACRVKTDTYYI